ncbi:MAG: hypothetical protein R3B06_02015 [Kofleriaceae bacterium]
MPDEATRDPGAPIGRDEIDPDLVRLRRPAPSIGMIAAAGVVILCVTLLVRLRHDWSYAGASTTARVVTPADLVAGKVGDNSFVAVDAAPDRAGAIRLRISEGSAGTRLAAVRGTANRVWLALPGESWDRFSHTNLVEGRLRRLADVRYGGPLAAALRRFPTPQFVSGVELARARAAGALELTTIDGDPLTVTPATDVELSVADPGAAIVVAALAPGRDTVDAWRAPLVAAGLITAEQAPIAQTADLVRWRVQRPDAMASVQAALDGAQLWGARVEASPTRLRTAWQQLTTTADGVRGPDGLIPWSAIDVAGIWEPRTVPAGAWVVLVDERPGDYWYLKPIFVGLLLVGLLAMWALVRAVRRTFFDGATVAAR